MKTIPQRVNEIISTGEEVQSFVVGAMGKIEAATDDGDLLIKLRTGRRGSLHLNEPLNSRKWCIKKHQGKWMVGHRKSHVEMLAKRKPESLGAMLAGAIGI